MPAAHLKHIDSFCQPVEIEAKLNLTGMDAGNLYIYRYDKADNRCTLIYKLGLKPPIHRTDKTGYLDASPTKSGILWSAMGRW